MPFPTLAAAGSFLGNVGAAAGGISALGGLFGMGGGGGGGADYSSLYASQLAPGQTRLSIAGQELAALMAPYVRSMQFETNIQGQQAYDQFNQAISKEATQAGLQAGIASTIASSALGNQDLRNKALMATEMLGPESAAKALQQYTSAVSTLQNTALTGETNLLQPTAQAQAQAGLQANMMRNQLASDIAKTNLDISRMQEDTRNKLALQRGQVEGQLAMKRFGAGLALAGQRAFS